MYVYCQYQSSRRKLGQEWTGKMIRSAAEQSHDMTCYHGAMKVVKLSWRIQIETTQQGSIQDGCCRDACVTATMQRSSFAMICM